MIHQNGGGVKLFFPAGGFAAARVSEMAGGTLSNWNKPVEKQTDVVKLEGYDVIVVGLGASGISSYVSAAENGATVFGIETAAKIGGNSSNTSGAMGVKAVEWDGSIYEVYGDSVVLATGGFIGNAEMSNQYVGGVWRTEAMTQCDGTGIRMAQEAADAALSNPDVAVMSHIAQVANIIRTDDLTKDQKAILSSLALDKAYPVVGADGTAYNDKIGMFFAFDVWQAGPVYYVIYAQEEIDGFRANGLAAANTPMFLAQGGTVEAGVPVADIDEILSVGEQYGNVIKAESIEALAEKLGMDKLVATVEAMGGKKDGAYVAVKGASYVYSTCGGLDINTTMNVLRADGTAVENLYAVGTDSMGVLFCSEKAYVTYGAAAHGWCWTSGKIAGEQAAANFAK